MDNVDSYVGRAEQDASPDRFPPSPQEKSHTKKHDLPDTLERTATASTTTSNSSTASSVQRQEIGMSRIATARETGNELERNQTVLSRIQTARSQHSATVGASIRSRKSNKPLPAFGAGKPYPPPLPEREEYVVEYEGPDDPLHAQNWPLRKKLLTGTILGFFTMIAAFGSSIFSAATSSVAQIYGVSSEVGILGVSLYVLGFATGPLIWAPLSELRGRRLPLVIASFGFSVFFIACATAKDFQTIMITRFFSGFFGACPLTVVAAVFSDMFDNRTRGIAITVFSMTVFSGPLLAPFIGGFIVTSYLGWRWTQYIVAFMGFLSFGLNLIFLEETYPPTILVAKASELRRRTKNWGIHAKQEEIEVDVRELVEKNFTRPLRMLVTEPIVLLITIYMAFVYGILYLFLAAYPLVFQKVHGMNPGVGGLPYFGMIIGEMLAGLFIVLRQPGYQRKLAANGGWPIPEWRLPEVIIGGVSFTIGLFWFGWTGYTRDIHWIVPTLSGLCSGFGIMSIFLQGLNYLVDAYLMFAASAIAANTFLRSLAGAGFPLFATYMFNGMGIQYAGTLLGCVAAVLVPVPVLFYLKGAKIRERSAYAPVKPVTEKRGGSRDEEAQ
ncbi:major facilitator superfamily [Phyllosticta citrichinensis]|uniref:Major facilitator superfamily n=1 Tax=Phyllosticta citrichinensis TaxID=1130410 RepID=A0ABR1XTR1_9PEZI